MEPSIKSQFDYSVFGSYEPPGRNSYDAEVVALSGGRSSADMLMRLKNGGLLETKNPIITMQNTGGEDITAINFVKDICQEIRHNIFLLEYRLTDAFKAMILRPGFSYQKFNNCEYQYIQEILNVEALNKFRPYSKSNKHPWYENGFYSNDEMFRVVQFNEVSLKYEPYIDVFLYKAAIRIMKNKQLLVPGSFGKSRWCSGEMKEKTMHRFLAGIGVERYINYVGMRYDEPRRVADVLAQNKDTRVEKDVPLHWDKIEKIHTLQNWAQQPFDLGRRPKEAQSIFNDYMGNCGLCQLKKRIKKLYLIQNGFKTGFWKQCELLASAYNGNKTSFKPTHGSYAELEIEALAGRRISIEEVLNDEEVEMQCTQCVS